MAHFRTESGDIITFVGKIKMQLFSPFFYDTNTYSMPVIIPATQQNKEILDFPNEINSIDTKNRQLNVSLISKTLNLLGVLIIDKPGDYEYEGTFIGQGAFWLRFKDILLNEIEFSEINYPSEVTTKTFSLIDVNDFIFNVENEPAYAFIPHFNTIQKSNYEFYNETADRITLRINGFFSYDRHYMPSIPPSNPWLMLRYVLKSMANYANCYISKNDTESQLFDNLFLYNNYSIEQATFVENATYNFTITRIEVIDEKKLKIFVTSGSYIFASYRFFKISNLTIPGFENINNRIFRLIEEEAHQGYIQIEVDTSKFTTQNVSSGNITYMDLIYSIPTQFEIGKHFPQQSIKNFINELAVFFGLYMLVGESSNSVKFCLFENVIKDKSFVDITSYSSVLYDKELSEITGISIKHSPVMDDYLTERFKNLKINNTLKSSVANLNSLPMLENSNGDVRFVESENVYYVWNSLSYGSRQIESTSPINIGNWTFFSEFVDYITEDASESKTTKFALIPGFSFNDGVRKDPRIEIAMNHEQQVEEKDCGLRLSLLKLISGRPFGIEYNENINLKFHGDLGIFNLFHRRSHDWKINRARPCKAQINWPIWLINDFAWDKTFRIKNTNYLVKSIEMYIGYDDSITFGETELVRK